jgi:hypothetical protein
LVGKQPDETTQNRHPVGGGWACLRRERRCKVVGC